MGLATAIKESKPLGSYKARRDSPAYKLLSGIMRSYREVGEWSLEVPLDSWSMAMCTKWIDLQTANLFIQPFNDQWSLLNRWSIMVINSHHEESWNGDQPQINREQDAETQGESWYWTILAILFLLPNRRISAMQSEPALWKYRSYSKMFLPKHFGLNSPFQGNFLLLYFWTLYSFQQLLNLPWLTLQKTETYRVTLHWEGNVSNSRHAQGQRNACHQITTLWVPLLCGITPSTSSGQSLILLLGPERRVIEVLSQKPLLWRIHSIS